MIEISELIKFINHEDFTPELAKECLAIYNEKNLILELDELGNVIEKEKNASFDDYELLNPSAVIEFYKESLIEKNNDTPEYKNKINLLDDIQDYCVSREENEVEFERKITYSNKSKLDLQAGFWTSTDGYKTKVHISTNYLSDDYVRLITDYENSDDEVKDYIDNLIAANTNESYITISINPTTKEIEYSLDGSIDAKVSTTNITKFLQEKYKNILIENLNNTLNEIDSVNISNTQEYKTQIGEKFTKYKEAVKWNLVKHIFKDKTSDMSFNGLDKANFDELYLDCKNSFPSKTDEELLVESASRMIISNVNDFGYFSVQNYDELFDKEDGTDYRFTLCEAAAKELLDSKISDFSQVEEYIKNQSKEVFKNECLKELKKQTFLDDVEKIVALSIESLDKDDFLDTYSYLTEEEYDRTKYLFVNFYKTENQTGSIDLNALYNSKESIDNVVTLENGAEIRKVIESDEGEEREYYDLYDKDLCSICDGENYEVKAVIDGTYYLKGLDSEYEDSVFVLSTDEYLIATKQQNQGKELGINEDTYVVLADKICQAAYETSASGFNYSFDLDEIATLADRDIDWVKTHIEKIGEALVEHNDELLLDFNPSESINLEEERIEFNFCSVGEDANELFKCVEGRWQRKTNRELEADGYIIPVDIKYSFTYKPNQSVRDEQQLLVDSICGLFIEDSEIIDRKVNSLPGGKFNIEFILRHDFAIEPGTDYFNLKFDNINDRILYEMNNIIKNNEKLHCFTIDSIKSFIPEEFHVRKNLVLINDETIENFSKTPEEYLKELNPEMVSFAGSSMWREEDYFISGKNNFLEIMEKYPAIKNYVEKKWDLLKEKSLQHEKEVELLWNKGIILFKDTKYWEDILTETPADFRENESFILSKLHSKFRQEIVDKFNPNENINWENESWNYICETMQRKSLNNNYSVNYNNGLTSKDLQDFIACDFITIKMNLQDKKQTDEEPMIKIVHYKEPDGFESWSEYDDKGNQIHYKDSKENETWYEYDDKGNEIHFKTSSGFETWSEYDDKGNQIHYKDSNGFESWKEYDDKRNEIHYKDSKENEKWYEYDDMGNVIHYKNSNGFESWKEYDDKGNKIHYKTSEGEENCWEYDSNGKLIHYKQITRNQEFEEWSEYNANGMLLHYKNSENREEWNEYDKDNLIYHRFISGNEIFDEYEDEYEDIIDSNIEEWFEYDEMGNLIHQKDSDEREYWYEYDEKGNLVHEKDFRGRKYWYEYDDKGNLIHEKIDEYYEKKEIWHKYNDEGQKIYSKDSHETEFWYEYDENGKEICYKSSYGLLRGEEVSYIPLEEYKKMQEASLEVKEKSKPNESYYLEYFFDNEPSLISWKEILSFNQDEPISFKQLKELLDNITEDNSSSSLSEKEQKEEVLFRLLEEKLDWRGFDYSLIDEGKLDSGKFLDTRCYCLEQISEGIVSKKIESFEEAQTMLNELLLNDNHANAFVLGKENNPLKILEEESKLSENISTFFRTQLLEEMKTTNNPFVASQRIVQELTKTNPDRLEELNSYFFENGCTSKKGFEKFFSNVIGLTKNKPIISKTKKEKDIEPTR